MKKSNSGNMCVTCYQYLKKHKGWEKIQEKHTELLCNYCGNIFRDIKSVDIHMDDWEAWKGISQMQTLSEKPY